MTVIIPYVACDHARSYVLGARRDEMPPVWIAQHLQECPACRAFAGAVDRTETSLRSVWARESAPPELWQRILRTIDSDDTRAGAVTAKLTAASSGIARLAAFLGLDRPGVLWRPLVGVVVASLLLVVVIADPLGTWRHGDVAPIVREPINDLITYRMSRRALDIASDDPHVISEWLTGKIDFLLPQPVPEIAGYHLVGSRLCYILNRRLSALMYQRGEHFVSLYIMSRERLDLPSGADEKITDWKITVHEHKGYTSLVWQEGSLAFALVSDLSRRDLLPAAVDLRRGWDNGRVSRVRPFGTPGADVLIKASDRVRQGRTNFFIAHAGGRLAPGESTE